MPHRTGTVRIGDLCVEREADGSYRLIRQSTAESILLSISEMEWLWDVIQLLSKPVAPPSRPAESA